MVYVELSAWSSWTRLLLPCRFQIRASLNSFLERLFWLNSAVKIHIRWHRWSKRTITSISPLASPTLNSQQPSLNGNRASLKLFFFGRENNIKTQFVDGQNFRKIKYQYLNRSKNWFDYLSSDCVLNKLKLPVVSASKWRTCSSFTNNVGKVKSPTFTKA